MCFRARAAELLVSSSDAASFASAKQEITRCLCTAAGVLDYIKDVELARWGEKPSAVSLLEKFAEFYAMLSTYVLRTNHRESAHHQSASFLLMLVPVVVVVARFGIAIRCSICLAEAQQLAIRYAASQGLGATILAKLCIDVRDKYRYAY
jgi:hypothetical protein